MSDHATAAVLKRSELEMSLNRFAFCLLISIYLIATHSVGERAGLRYIACYFVFSLMLFLWVKNDSRPNMKRATLALAGDFATISFEMHVGGAVTSVFYPIYLWVILGNGFRFGLRFLFVSMGAALIGFGLVCLTTPFWIREAYLCWGLFVGLILVPGYGGTLIAKLSSARREAEAANKAKSMFLASVSHSVRTPLNAILGSIGLLKGTPLDEEQGELVRKLELGTGLLMSLVDGILDFTQIEANKMPVRLAATDIGMLAMDMRTLLAPQAQAKGVRMWVHVGASVPEQVLSDQRHLHEILVNLVGNALKFTEAGSIVLAVTGTPLPDGQVRLSLKVSDTGIGIREDALERIFDSFTQADGSIIDRFGGTGLGLSIVRRLVLLLGGRVTVTSTLGAGSVFTVTLDCTVSATQREDAPAGRPFHEHRIVLVSASGGASDAARRLDRLGLTVERATTKDQLSGLPDRVDEGTTRKPILLLDAPHKDRLAVSRMLATVDPWGSLPRILVAPDQERDADDVAWIQSNVTTTLDGNFEPEQLRLAARLCWEGAAEVAPVSDPLPNIRALDILVADDNLTNQLLVKKILERAGHRPYLVQNGEDAVIALTERSFDLALLDLNMPVMNGLEAAKEYSFLSLGRQPVPLVALTADATPETARRCADAGMIDCITKPITPDALIARIHALMPVSAPALEAAPAPLPSTVAHIRSHPHFRTALPPLDPQVLAGLDALGGAEFTAELLEGFVSEAYGLVRHLGEAAAGQDLMMFRNHGHALRSTAANVGATIVHELSGQCRDVAPDMLGIDGIALSREIRAAIDGIRRELSTRDRVGRR